MKKTETLDEFKRRIHCNQTDMDDIIESYYELKQEKSKRWVFESDDDGHTYLIPLEEQKEFRQLLEPWDSFDENKFFEKFDDKRIGCSTTLYSFTDPKIDTKLKK